MIRRTLIKLVGRVDSSPKKQLLKLLLVENELRAERCILLHGGVLKRAMECILSFVKRSKDDKLCTCTMYLPFFSRTTGKLIGLTASTNMEHRDTAKGWPR
jgi:hypothetical protein